MKFLFKYTLLINILFLSGTLYAQNKKNCKVEDLAKIFKTYAKASSLIMSSDMSATNQILADKDLGKQPAREVFKKFISLRLEKRKELSTLISELDSFAKAHPECNVDGIYDYVSEVKQ